MNLVCSLLATSVMHKNVECGCFTFLANHWLLYCNPSFWSNCLTKWYSLEFRDWSQPPTPRYSYNYKICVEAASQTILNSFISGIGLWIFQPKGWPCLNAAQDPRVGFLPCPESRCQLPGAPPATYVSAYRATLTPSHFGILQTSSGRDHFWMLSDTIWFYCF